MNEQKRIVEINGVNIEVDLREAVTVDKYRVGMMVRLLVKNYSGYSVKHGVIVDFAMFKNLPTIEVLAIDVDKYASGGLQFYTYNAETSDVEIAPLGHMDALFKRDDVLERMDKEIAEMESKLASMRMKRDVFLDKFDKFFVETAKSDADVGA